MNYRERIRKAIECPQFGNERYGEWGALNLEKRILIKRLLDELDRADNYVKRLYLENQELKKRLETYEIEGYKQDEELNKMSFDIRKYKIQQKEFINYLEDESKKIYRDGGLRQNIYKEVLKKYKEIIGENNEYKKNRKNIA